GISRTFSKLEAKGRLGEGITAEKLLSNLAKTTDLAAAVKDADIVLEAVIENMKIKKDVFKTCADNAPAHCVLASNTSSMSISEIAKDCGTPEKVVGIHFFNPVPVMKLVEVIKGDLTTDETMDIAAAWAGTLPCRGKRYVARVLKDRPGFLANRVAAPGFIYLNWGFEQAVVKGISWEALNADTIKETSPMGLLELGDYVGHDTYLHINNYYKDTLHPDFAPSEFFTKFVADGNLGRKTKKGFFDWSQGFPKLDKTTKAGILSVDVMDAIEANEGCRCLEEGVVNQWEVIDNAMMAGFNRPGVMAAATEKHVEWVALLEETAAKLGKEYLKPCALFKSGKFIEMK
ncbi:MAG: 3-hydroxyacyl-CoA dehydrogenase NAD-binding domain-containing protein, partial [Promethearchaeota archaeon]